MAKGPRITLPPKGLRRNRAAGIVLDDETGIVMIYVRKRKRGERNAFTKEVARGWIVSFDEHCKPIDIEVLNPSEAFPPAVLKLLPPEFLPPGPRRKDSRS